MELNRKRKTESETSIFYVKFRPCQYVQLRVRYVPDMTEEDMELIAMELDLDIKRVKAYYHNRMAYMRKKMKK